MVDRTVSSGGEERGTGALRAFGEYRLVRKLASGGMADIFLAKQLGPLGFERDVVIKRLKPHLYERDGFLEMFLDEARLAAHLSHPNVVQIHDVGCIGGHYFLCLEYLAGDDVGQWVRETLRRGEEVPPTIAAQIIAQAAHGLHYAHELRDADGTPLNIVHRDVSPANLFVTYQGHVKVLDFGIARAKSRAANTDDGKVKGKTTYLAPELLCGAAADPRSDVYALGLTLYVMLTQHQPFHRDSPLETMRAISAGHVPPVTAFRSDVSEGLAAVVVRAMARDPKERFQSADELAQALEFYLADFTASTANTALRAWLRHIAGDERIRDRSYVPTIATLQARGMRVCGFTDPDHRVAHPATPTPTPPPLPRERAVAPTPPIVQPVPLPPSPAPAPRRWPPHLAAAASMLIVAAATVAAAAIIQGKDPGQQVIASQPVTRVFEPVLEVRCDAEGATLEIDGFERGTCPLDARVDAGRHVVVARAPGREAVVREVNVGFQDDRVLVMLNLPEPPEVIERQAPQVGRLTLDTVPWTRVYRNGALVGETPVVEAKLPRGKHRLRLINAERGIDRVVTVDVLPGKLTVQRLHLDARTR